MLSTVLMMRRSARPNRALSKTTAVAVPSAARGRTSRLGVAGAGIVLMRRSSWKGQARIFAYLSSQSSKSTILSVDQVKILKIPPRACQASFFDPVCRRCETRIPSPRHISCWFFHSHDGAPIFVPTASLSVSLDQPTRFGTSSIDSIDHHLVVTAAFLTVDPVARETPDQLFFGKFEQFSARPFGIVQKLFFSGIPFGRTLHSPRVCIYIQYIYIDLGPVQDCTNRC